MKAESPFITPRLQNTFELARSALMKCCAYSRRMGWLKRNTNVLISLADLDGQP